MRELVIILVALWVGCGSDTAKPGPEAGLEESGTPPEPEPESYLACGCGCCGGFEPQIQCLSRQGGETLRSIIARDKEAAASPQCPFAGCSFPRKYLYCDAPSPTP
jgi:hypothetical protein